MFCGIDIIEVDRIKKAITSNKNFIHKIYSEKEIQEIDNINSDMKYQRYAGRFAAKEAVFKAISKILKQNNISIDFKDIEILNDENRRPYINFLNKEVSNIFLNYKIDISISHIKESAEAMCTVE